jgi:hypothetical protein
MPEDADRDTGKTSASSEMLAGSPPLPPPLEHGGTPPQHTGQAKARDLIEAVREQDQVIRE